MVNVSDIKWGSYKEYEGSLYHGKTKMAAPPLSAPETHTIVYIMTQTEGGSFSSVNGYDKCGKSLGLHQWCEFKYHFSSRLLGRLIEAEPALMTYLDEPLRRSNATFKPNAQGKWRFFVGGVEVTTLEQQQRLFLLNSNGLKGSWDEASKVHTKMWDVAFVNLLEDPRGHAAHVQLCAGFVMNFATKDAKALLFDAATPSKGWVGAMRAIYLSYAGNLPAVADKHLKIALATAPGPKWTKEWVLHITKELAFGPQITIFPGRYDAIRPWVEHYFGVDLPDFSAELKAWRASTAPAGGVPSTAFESVKEIQQLLLDLGYGIGPAGADGVMGKKSKEALVSFQKANGLTPDGLIGPKTRAKMIEVRAQLDAG